MNDDRTGPVFEPHTEGVEATGVVQSDPTYLDEKLLAAHAQHYLSMSMKMNDVSVGTGFLIADDI